MDMKVKAPACVGAQNRSEPNPLKPLNLKEIGIVKVPHHPEFINELPLWTAARLRDLKRPNPVTGKLRKRLGVSESVARVIADLSGLGSKEGC